MKIRDIKTLCPICAAEIPGELYEADGDVYLFQRCPEHGERRALYFKSAQVYRTALRSDDPGLPKPDPIDLSNPKVADYLTTFAIDVTTRCNLRCPNCFSRADDRSAMEDPSIDEILEMIPDCRDMAGTANISLVGGESTLRKDLPEIIKAIIEQKGLVPRLNTNGLLLLGNDLLLKLKKAGLRWIILQFDSFDPGVSMALRGRDLISVKEEVIDKASKMGFFFHLAVMVKKGINDQETGHILKYAAAHPNIRRVSFYPCSDVGRIDESDHDETHILDVMQAISKGTDGQVRIEDILVGKKIGQRVFRLTGNPMFRSRPCIFPFIIYSQGRRLIPCNRFFSPRWMIKEMRAFMMFARHALKMLKPDTAHFPSNFLFVNIEKFYSDHGFDLAGARNCHHIYLTKHGAYPFCCYNTLYRNAKGAIGK